MWCSNPDGRRGKDGYAGPSVGGPIGYVGLGVVLLLMVGFQEEEVRKALKEKDISGGDVRGRMMISTT